MDQMKIETNMGEALLVSPAVPTWAKVAPSDLISMKLLVANHEKTKSKTGTGLEHAQKHHH